MLNIVINKKKDVRLLFQIILFPVQYVIMKTLRKFYGNDHNVRYRPMYTDIVTTKNFNFYKRLTLRVISS